MRVCIISETYLPQINGVSRTLDRLTRHLVAHGDEVRLIVPRYHEGEIDDPPDVERADLPAFALPFYKEVVTPIVSPWRLRRLISEFRPDVAHVATEGPLGWSALRALRRLGTPTVSSYHTNFAQYSRHYHVGFLEPVLWRYLRWFHNRTRRTFCPSASIRDMLEEKGFRNVEVWSRGVDSELFHPDRRDPAIRAAHGVEDGETVLICVGRLALEKNIETLIEAFRRLPAQPRCRLMLVGDGPARAKIERSNPDPRLILAGYRRGVELAAYYASADLLVFPSLTETFGNVALEGMAAGLPAIGFNVPGPKDVIQSGRTGLLAGETTPEALAAAMRELIENADRRREMAAAARAHAVEQTWERINQVVRDGYLAAIEEARATRA